MGEWSDGLLPIKMMDQLPAATFCHTRAHTNTHTFFYTLTQTYRTVGDENKSVMGHSPPGGFKPEKHNPFGLSLTFLPSPLSLLTPSFFSFSGTCLWNPS